MQYSDVQSGWPGQGNIDADPLFVDPANGDLRLVPGSPCIDAGDNTAVPEALPPALDRNPPLVAAHHTPRRHPHPAPTGRPPARATGLCGAEL